MPWRCRYDDCDIEGEDDAPILLSLRGSYVLLNAQTTALKADPAADRANFRLEDLAEIRPDLAEIRHVDLAEWLRLVRVAIASGASDSTPLAFCSKQHLFQYVSERLRVPIPSTPS